MCAHPHQVNIRHGIRAMVKDAVGKGRVLHTGPAAEQLATRYPESGMTVRQIEDQIIRQIGQAHGTAEIGHAENRPTLEGASHSPDA